MKRIIYFLSLTVIVLNTLVFSKTFYIHNTPPKIDHSDPTDRYTIAWYFETMQAGHRFILDDINNPEYIIESELELPEYSTLKATNMDITIKAENYNTNYGRLLELNNNCTIENITINGNQEVMYCIYASGKENINIRNCIVENTKIHFPFTVSGTYIIGVQNTENTNISDCIIRNATCNDTDYTSTM